MSSLLVRSISSVVFVIVLLGAIYLGFESTLLVYSILGLFTLTEFYRITHTPRALKFIGILIHLSVFLILYGVSDIVDIAILTLIGFATLAVFLQSLLSRHKSPFEDIGKTIVGNVYVSIPFALIPYFFILPHGFDTFWLLTLLFGSIWVNDSGAYLVGSMIGKTKLIERISPNKTIEGSAGGALLSLIVIGFASTQLSVPPLPIMLVLILLCVLFGSLGDLVQSVLKRSLNLKDSGKFLPGHGGFLDRFDAMLLAIPAAFLALNLWLNL